jgi:hypothetical protein
MDRPVRPGVAVLLSASVFLCLGSGCGKEGGNRTTKVSSAEPVRQKEVAQPTETAMPGPKPNGNVSLKLVPENPDALTGLRAVLANSPPGARMLPENFRWFVNGVETEGEKNRLPGKILRRDDIVHATATVAVNGEDVSLESSPSIIGNARPEIVSADLSPLTPRKGEVMRVAPRGRDADGDTVTFRMRWFVNDEEIPGETSDKLSLKTVSKGSWVHAEVQSFDGIAAGSKMFTPKILVVNAPPIVDRVAFTQGEGSVYSANVMVIDPDGDPVTIRQKTLPEGVVLSGSVLTGDVSPLPPGTEAPVVLRISDGDGGDIEYTFRLTSSQK